ncbi:diguanylate cyclase [Fundidesulfovibrio terrae]|uniref:diguanylate cyclase n=1 Tax=Fundidesulfovibrio terrae TaxID=2922866 RepID=UPI001FB02665|nr:diguanylate cyclase [Fundidesulfovibrio terrae]
MNNLSVLIVEDDAPSRLGLTLALETKVCQVIQADNGVTGLEYYRRLSPDVIITDIRMPCMDGLSMIRGVRDTGGDPFVIVASGYGEEGFYLDAIELGVNLFIKKPYHAEDIFSGLHRASGEIGKRKHDAYRRALSDGLLANVPNCHLLTDGNHVLYFNDPQQILPRQASERQELGPYLRGNFTLALRHGMAQSSLPQSILPWLARHAGREFILAGIASPKHSHPARYLLRIDQVCLHDEELHLLTFTDISRIESERTRFYQLAGRDFLTGVGNRQAFETELSREMGRAKRYGSDLCLVMLDIDDFKAVNDLFGHQTGDSVLVSLARTISTCVRVTDIVCRFGGEEFMVVMPQTSLDGALSGARKLGETIAAQDFGINRQLTVSIGVAQYQDDEASQTLIRRVDNALYEAKNAGKNRVIIAQGIPFSCAEN